MKIKAISIALLATLPLFAQAQSPAVSAAAAGELALVTGSVNAAGPNGSRSLTKGDAVYVGDTLLVGANSYASLKFADGGRILLRPNTDFTVEAFQYTAPPEAPAAGAAPAVPAAKPKAAVGQQQAFFRLLRGGFRAISGFIGQSDRQNYRVSTPVATIGIRGTDYEVQLCDEDCPEAPGTAQGENVQLASADLAGLELAQSGESKPIQIKAGLLLATNDGTVAMKTSKGEYLVKVGEVAFALANGQVFMLPAVPDALLVHPNNSPEDCN